MGEITPMIEARAVESSYKEYLSVIKEYASLHGRIALGVVQQDVLYEREIFNAQNTSLSPVDKGTIDAHKLQKTLFFLSKRSTEERARTAGVTKDQLPEAKEQTAAQWLGCFQEVQKKYDTRYTQTKIPVEVIERWYTTLNIYLKFNLGKDIPSLSSEDMYRLGILYFYADQSVESKLDVFYEDWLFTFAQGEKATDAELEDILKNQDVLQWLGNMFGGDSSDLNAHLRHTITTFQRDPDAFLSIINEKDENGILRVNRPDEQKETPRLRFLYEGSPIPKLKTKDKKLEGELLDIPNDGLVNRPSPNSIRGINDKEQYLKSVPVLRVFSPSEFEKGIETNLVIKFDNGEEKSYNLHIQSASQEPLTVLAAEEVGQDAVGLEILPNGIIDIALADGVSNSILPHIASRESVLEAIIALRSQLPQEALKAAWVHLQGLEVVTIANNIIEDPSIRPSDQNKFIELIKKGSLAQTTLTTGRYIPHEGKLQVAVKGNSGVLIIHEDGTCDPPLVQNDMNRIVYDRRERNAPYEGADEDIIREIQLRDKDTMVFYTDCLFENLSDFSIKKLLTIIHSHKNDPRADKLIIQDIQNEIKKKGFQDDLSVVVITHRLPHTVKPDDISKTEEPLAALGSRVSGQKLATEPRTFRDDPSQDEGYAQAYWDRARKRGESDTQKEDIKHLLRWAIENNQGVLNFSTSTITTEDREFLAAYRQVAREMGYEVGEYTFNPKTSSTKAQITKIETLEFSTRSESMALDPKEIRQKLETGVSLSELPAIRILEDQIDKIYQYILSVASTASRQSIALSLALRFNYASLYQRISEGPFGLQNFERHDDPDDISPKRDQLVRSIEQAKKKISQTQKGVHFLNEDGWLYLDQGRKDKTAYRIYLSPRLEDVGKVFAAVAHAIPEKVSYQMKTFDNPGPVEASRIDKIIIYSSEENFDEILRSVAKVYGENHVSFEGRPSPGGGVITYLEGISIAKQPEKNKQGQQVTGTQENADKFEAHLTEILPRITETKFKKYATLQEAYQSDAAKFLWAALKTRKENMVWYVGNAELTLEQRDGLSEVYLEALYHTALGNYVEHRPIDASEVTKKFLTLVKERKISLSQYQYDYLRHDRSPNYQLENIQSRLTNAARQTGLMIAFDEKLKDSQPPSTVMKEIVK